jgi:hypothetical protein
VNDPECRKIGHERRIDGLEQRRLDLIHTQPPQIDFRVRDGLGQPPVDSMIFTLVSSADPSVRLPLRHRIDIGYMDFDAHATGLQNCPVPS